MSKIAELKVDIPNYGDGVIINVYSSVEDMANDQYTNDYILVEAEYDGEYHKNCPIAVTYSRTNEAFEEFGTEWTLLDADGKTCYVMTEPYFPHECIVTYKAPEITLCYNANCDQYIDMAINASITPIAKPTYTQEWTDSCGNSGVETGELEYSDIRFTRSDTNLQYELNGTNGEFTVGDMILAKDGGGTGNVGYLYVYTSINGVYGSSNYTYIRMSYIDSTADFLDYTIWIYYNRGTAKEYTFTPLYITTNRVQGAFYYFNSSRAFTLMSYPSYSDAIAAGRTGPDVGPDEKSGNGYYILNAPAGGDEFFFTLQGYDGIYHATCGANGIIDLTDDTGELG